MFSVIWTLICVVHRKPISIHFWGSASGCPSSWLWCVCGLRKIWMSVPFVCSDLLRSTIVFNLLTGCFWGPARRPAWCRCGASDLAAVQGESLQSDPEWCEWGGQGAPRRQKCQSQGLWEWKFCGAHYHRQCHGMWVTSYDERLEFHFLS